jgi:fatty-acyl-CoA synthase
MNVLDFFDRSLSRFILQDGSTVTAGAIRERGCTLAARWRATGLMPGDRVAIWLPNVLTYLEVLAACAAGRFVAVSVNTRFSAAEAQVLLSRSGAKVVVDGAWTPPSIQGGRIELEPPEPQDPFVVFTTSGTTSRPKMVLHTQKSIAAHGCDAAAGLGYTPDDVVLLTMPLCGTFGLSSLTAAMAANATIVLEDHFDVVGTAARIVRHRVTAVNGSDDMYHRLLLHGADLSTIRLGGYARFNSSLEGIVDRAEQVGATLTGLYGMSEVQALFAARSRAGDAAWRSLAGGTLVAKDAAFRIVDGELWLRGPSLFAGYLAEGGHGIDPVLTDAAFTDGWFRTGDVAEGPEQSDEIHRTFTYITRMGDALRLGGFLVSPADVEQRVLEVPGVEQALVVAVDMPAGARPVAFVIAPGGVDEAAVISHCSAHLARYKVPIKVIALDAFPVTPSANGNKIQNGKLREMAERALRG